MLKRRSDDLRSSMPALAHAAGRPDAIVLHNPLVQLLQARHIIAEAAGLHAVELLLQPGCNCRRAAQLRVGPADLHAQLARQLAKAVLDHAVAVGRVLGQRHPHIVQVQPPHVALKARRQLARHKRQLRILLRKVVVEARQGLELLDAAAQLLQLVCHHPGHLLDVVPELLLGHVSRRLQVRRGAARRSCPPLAGRRLQQAAARMALPSPLPQELLQAINEHNSQDIIITPDGWLMCQVARTRLASCARRALVFKLSGCKQGLQHYQCWQLSLQFYGKQHMGGEQMHEDAQDMQQQRDIDVNVRAWAAGMRMLRMHHRDGGGGVNGYHTVKVALQLCFTNPGRSLLVLLYSYATVVVRQVDAQGLLQAVPYPQYMAAQLKAKLVVDAWGRMSNPGLKGILDKLLLKTNQKK